jgi:hypothetical protein
MDKSIEIKLKGMLWDLPAPKRDILFRNILQNPGAAFRDEELLIRGLNSLSWYDLIQILGSKELLVLLSESVIGKLFPPQRRIFYKDAKELLSKYTISSAG